MIVNQLDIIGVAILEPKHHAPVRPRTLTLQNSFSSPLSRCSPKAGETHVFKWRGSKGLGPHRLQSALASH
jgi:hypothetical protein